MYICYICWVLKFILQVFNSLLRIYDSHSLKYHIVQILVVWSLTPTEGLLSKVLVQVFKIPWIFNDSKLMVSNIIVLTKLFKIAFTDTSKVYKEKLDLSFLELLCSGGSYLDSLRLCTYWVLKYQGNTSSLTSLCIDFFSVYVYIYTVVTYGST